MYEFGGRKSLQVAFNVLNDGCGGCQYESYPYEAQLPVRIDDKYIRQANIVSTNYIKPNLKNDRYLTLTERATLLRLDVLLSEVTAKKHPQYRVREIINLSNQYVALNKKRDEEISRLLEELKHLVDNN